MSITHVQLFSGGLGSWASAKRVVAKYGVENTRLLFTDTMMEDEDLYKFLPLAAKNIGVKSITILRVGLTPWEVTNEKNT